MRVQRLAAVDYYCCSSKTCASDLRVMCSSQSKDCDGHHGAHRSCWSRPQVLRGVVLRYCNEGGSVSQPLDSIAASATRNGRTIGHCCLLLLLPLASGTAFFCGHGLQQPTLWWLWCRWQRLPTTRPRGPAQAPASPVGTRVPSCDGREAEAEAIEASLCSPEMCRRWGITNKRRSCRVSKKSACSRFKF